MLKISITSAKDSNAYPDDLPFDKSSSPRFIGWIVAMMVYLTSLFLILSLCASEVYQTWSQQTQDGFTVELSPPESVRGGTQIRELSQQWKALEILGKVRGVVKTEVISKSTLSQFSSLVQGQQSVSSQTPQPVMIDVQVDPRAGLDFESLTKLFAREIPGATLKKEREFYEGMNVLASLGIGISFLVTLLIIGCAFAISIFSAHSGLIIHKKIIEILHLVGAHNAYIAKQFQNHAFQLGFRGGMIGSLLTLSSLIFAIFFLNMWDVHGYTDILLSMRVVFTIFFIPLVTTLVMMGAARVTVMWELSRYP